MLILLRLYSSGKVTHGHLAKYFFKKVDSYFHGVYFGPKIAHIVWVRTLNPVYKPVYQSLQDSEPKSRLDKLPVSSVYEEML